MSESTKLVVLGGGPGGYPAAFYAADHGMDVTLINAEANPGGVCLYRGCIPSKALLHIAKLIEESKEAAEWGVEFKPPKINLKKLMGFKDKVIGNLTGGLGKLSRMRGVNYIEGYGRFTGPREIEVEKADGGKETVAFDHCIVATGSHPTKIPVFDIGSPNVVDSTGALEIDKVPKRFMVLGGGYIGLEMGTVYAALGSEVTVVEMLPNILAGADKDLASQLAKRLKTIFKEIRTKTKVLKMEQRDDGVHVTMEGKDGETTEVFDKVLVSIGRRPNSAGFGLENTEVQVDDQGFIVTDDQRRTVDPGIFCIGDVAGEPMLAHKATAEGKVAVEAILGKKTVFEPAAIPAVVFTDPEVAWAGLTEAEAKERGIPVKVAKFPWAASGRATTLDRSDGLTKLIIHPETEQVLGVGICGPGAGELIAEGTLAIEMGANVEDLSLTIHPHPTLSETVMEAAEVHFNHSPHFFRGK